MKPDKLFDLLGQINESAIDEAMSTDNAGKLRKLKRQSHWFHSATFTRYAAVAACFIFILTLSSALSNNIGQKSDTAATTRSNVQIGSPIVTVSSVEEMEEYLNFNIPVSVVNTPINFTVYRIDNIYFMGEIKYSNGLIFKKAKDTNNLSGINDGKTISTYEKEGVTVTISSYDNYLYTEWTENEYSYCILGQTSDRPIIESVTDEMIGMENNK